MYTKRQSCVYSNTIIELFKEVVNIRLHCSTSQTSLLAIFPYSGFPKRKWKSKWNGITRYCTSRYSISSLQISACSTIRYSRLFNQVSYRFRYKLKCQTQGPILQTFRSKGRQEIDLTSLVEEEKPLTRLSRGCWMNVTVTIGIARDERRDNLSL